MGGTIADWFGICRGERGSFLIHWHTKFGKKKTYIDLWFAKTGSILWVDGVVRCFEYLRGTVGRALTGLGWEMRLYRSLQAKQFL